MSFWLVVGLACIGIIIFGAGWLVGHRSGLDDAVRIFQFKQRIEEQSRSRDVQIEL